MSQLFCVDEFECLSPNVVKCSILCFEIYIHIFETKDPHLSEVNEVRVTVRILLLHFHTFGIIIEGKTDLADWGRLLVFGCIENEALKEWVLFDLVIVIFFIGHEVNVRLNFPYYINMIVDCVYLFIDPHFSEFAFGVVPQVEVWELQSLFWIK